jgi:hypothetical protein
MTTKTTILLGAAAGAMMLLGAGGAGATTTCGLNQNQLNRGFYCVEETGTQITRTQIGSVTNPRCKTDGQDGIFFQAYNQNDQPMEGDDKQGFIPTGDQYLISNVPGTCP